jgi:hypothetical protein
VTDKTRRWLGYAMAVGALCLLIWFFLSSAPALNPAGVTAPAEADKQSPFGALSGAVANLATEGAPNASSQVGAASQAVPVWGGPSPLTHARAPAGADPVAFKKALAFTAFTQYKNKFLKTFESGQTISPTTFQIMAQETETHYKAGYLSLLDYFAANEVLLRAQYQGAALEAQLTELARKIDGMSGQLKNQSTPEDEKFKVYKQKEATIIQKADKMKEFPDGMSKENYILKQVEAIR